MYPYRLVDTPVLALILFSEPHYTKSVKILCDCNFNIRLQRYVGLK